MVTEDIKFDSAAFESMAKWNYAHGLTATVCEYEPGRDLKGSVVRVSPNVAAAIVKGMAADPQEWTEGYCYNDEWGGYHRSYTNTRTGNLVTVYY
jgi:hypothetical protein